MENFFSTGHHSSHRWPRYTMAVAVNIFSVTTQIPDARSLFGLKWRHFVLIFGQNRERFRDGLVLKLPTTRHVVSVPSAAADSGKKELQCKEVLSHSLSTCHCLLFADFSKVLKENAIPGIRVATGYAVWNGIYLEPFGSINIVRSLNLNRGHFYSKG